MIDLKDPIPDSLISTKVLLDAYSHLREKLNGQCSHSICPHINIRYFLEPINIPSSKKKKYYSRSIKHNQSYRYKRLSFFCCFCWDSWNTVSCPCKNNLEGKYIFLRLDKVIDQLQEKLNKEFSS